MFASFFPLLLGPREIFGVSVDVKEIENFRESIVDVHLKIFGLTWNKYYELAWIT